jgi:ribonucleoside-triphosphate reductase
VGTETDPSYEVLPTPYQQYMHLGKYARWDYEKERRETWPETVGRYCDWMVEQASDHGWEMGDVAWEVRDEIIRSPFPEGGALPSMRALMTAGEALLRDNVAGYNCAYVTVDHPRAFDESMYILMCGTGVGFSVERQYVSKLPEVPDQFFDTDDVIVVDDSRKGWAAGFRKLLAMLWTGHVPRWDLSRLRPKGSILKTFGGRSSGPDPLDALFRYVVATFKSAAGRKLTSVEAHGIMCMIGKIVVSGGVRRSAMISLSNPSDERMREAKSGNWYDDPMKKHFSLANNSAAWTDKPDPLRFFEEVTSLIRSKSGERGIVNRKALQKQASRWGRRDPDLDYGVNPCCEIILRPQEFCNLTTVVVRPGDGMEDLKRKVRAATIMGCVQATLTDFKYLRGIWKKNCEEERLLGVSIGGQMDHPVVSEVNEQSGAMFEELRDYARAVCEEISELLGVEVSVAITCQKPDGNCSQFVDMSSGQHRRHAPYYFRRTREMKGDPLAEFCREMGVPCEEDVMEPNNWVFTWPVKAPDGAKTREDDSAIAQLQMWLHMTRHWCEHKPSVTVTVRDDEWPDVVAFVYRHWDEMSGVSFLPHSDHIYQQAPYETITSDQYAEAAAAMPDLDWRMLAALEREDRTTGAKELACTANGCEI